MTIFSSIQPIAMEDSCSVSEVNRRVRQSLEVQPLLWVHGEITDLMRASSGHVYFTLKDDKAQLRCVMFRRYSQFSVVPLQEGLMIKSYGQPTLYEARGNFQLQVMSVQEFGIGALQRAFEQLKKKLAQQGIFDAQHKKSIPEYPKCVGLITSIQGAALHDLLAVLKRRAPQLPIIIYPSQVQGDAAIEQLIHAIEIANQRQECEVLILARGGGSAEDLAVFNDPGIAHSIFDSQLPVITGIGHDINISIADLVADLAAPTPSAAAEQLTAHIPKWPDQLQQLQTRLQQSVHRHLSQARQQLNQLHQRLRHPKEQLVHHAHYLNLLQHQLLRAYKHVLQGNRQQLSSLGQQLHTISPLNTLQRGYSWVEDEQKRVIHNSNQVTLQQKLTIRLAQGSLVCKVISIEKNSHNKQT